MPNNILLIEPDYPNKYPPLGLMKIAQYHGRDGKSDNVCFIKGEDSSVLDKHWDRVYITTLFSFEFSRIAKSIDFSIKAVNGDTDRIFVGGIAASLMYEKFLSEVRWRGVRFIKGLLNKSPAISLQLDSFSDEFYADDITGLPIEDYIPDYSILKQIDYQYPVRDAYFTYASRGCVRKCKFCGVPKLEGEQRDTESLTDIVSEIEKKYGAKKDLILMDNNVVASARFKEIIAEIRDLGFSKGAKLKRNGRGIARRVDFNQGVDARILCKNSMFLRELSTICINPLRIAFDHVGLRKPYEQAIRYAHEFGLNQLSNYMLYNFHDTPQDLFDRMRLNVSLNEELGVRIFSFPMRYQPTDRPDRGHIGVKWNRYWLRSFQIILQATHGIVSGSPNFFKHAFGDCYEEFENILYMPHAYIRNRTWFSAYDGKSELENFHATFSKLTAGDRHDLLSVLSQYRDSELETELAGNQNAKVRNMAVHYRKFTVDEERMIWAKMKSIKSQGNAFSKQDVEDTPFVPEDECVEDAGLNDPVVVT